MGIALTTLTTLATMFVCIVMASFLEWTLHKYVMHRPVGSFSYAYEAHARVHHTRYRADDSYHLHERHAGDTKITMAWWNGIVLISGGMLPYLITGTIFYQFGFLHIAIAIWGSSLMVCVAYYVGYEFTHWCMHNPQNRWVERQRWYQWLNAHHLLHHKDHSKNLNVLFPLADWCLGTLITRAKYPFPQTRGPSVPDVQP